MFSAVQDSIIHYFRAQQERLMTAIPRAMEMVRQLVPDLEDRISQFEVEAFELDDELIEAFHEELDRLSGDLRRGMADPDAVREAAHSMKGMAGTMGLPEISVLSHEIEIMVRQNEMGRCGMLCDAMVNWAADFNAAH
jgi:HPt (histidine-containing phosphotransfer) domain-containing protein